MGIGRVLHVPTRPQLVPDDSSAGIRSRMDTREEVPDIGWTTFHGVLQPKGINDERRIIEVEARDHCLVLRNRRRFS